MTQFKVYASKNNEDQIIGATVVAYDGKDKVIEKITVLDEDEVSKLRRLVSELDAKHTGDVSRIDGEISRIDSELDGKSPVGHNHNSSYYSKAYIDDLEDGLVSRIGDIVSFDTVVVDKLPSSGVKGVFYFVPKSSSDDLNNVYEEFIWIDDEGVFEFVGSTEVSVDLSNYYTKSEVDGLIELSGGGSQGYTVIPDGADLNDYTVQGLYITEEMADPNIHITHFVNCPVGCDFLLEVREINGEDGRKTILQTLHSNYIRNTYNGNQTFLLENNTETWERIYTRDRWGEWIVHYSSYNFHPEDYYKKTETDTLLQAKAPNTVASTTVNGLMSSTDKTKLDGIAEGANKTVVDSSLSSSSVNPVQNKIVYRELANKVDSGHNHDERYYTESEVDSKLSNKSDTGHTHDDRYYTESEVDSKLGGKANSSHNHSRLYAVDIPAYSDLNDYTTQGSYKCPMSSTAMTISNVPDPDGWAFHLEVYETTGGNGARQVFYTYTPDNVRTWTRNHYENRWSPWYEIYTTFNTPYTASDLTTNFHTTRVGQTAIISWWRRTITVSTTDTWTTLYTLPFTNHGRTVYTSNICDQTGRTIYFRVLADTNTLQYWSSGTGSIPVHAGQLVLFASTNLGGGIG